MKYFLGILLLFFISCGQKKGTASKLPNGIYFVAGNPDTATTRIGYHLSDSLPDDTASILVFTKTMLSDKNFSSIYVRQDPKDGMLFILNQTGLEKIHELQKENKNQKIVFILNGEIAGMSDLSKPESGQQHFEISPMGNADSLRKWSEKISKEFHVRDSIAAIRPKNGHYKIYYESGKLKREEFYKDSSQTGFKEYYESGKLKNETCYDCYGKFHLADIKEYYEDGKLESRKTNDEGAWIRYYYHNGMLEELDSSMNAFGEYEFVTDFDSLGNITYKSTLSYIGKTTDEFDCPRIDHQKEFENGKLKLEGDIYSGCGECDSDTIGIWKFYENGKLIRTKNYPPLKKFFDDRK